MIRRRRASTWWTSPGSARRSTRTPRSARAAVHPRTERTRRSPRSRRGSPPRRRWPRRSARRAGLHWQDAEVLTDASRPAVARRSAARVAAPGRRAGRRPACTCRCRHDAGIASACVVPSRPDERADRCGAAALTARRSPTSGPPRTRYGAVPPGALMQRAAAGAGRECARAASASAAVYGRARRPARRRRRQRRRRAVRRRPAGPPRRPGRRAVLLARPRPRRRSRRAARGRRPGRATGDAAAARPRCRRRPRRRRHRRHRRPRAGCAPGAAALVEAVARAARRSSPSTCRAASTRTPARSPGAARPRRRHRHVRHGQARPAGDPGRGRRRPVRLVDIGLGPHLPASRRARALEAADVPAAAAARRRAASTSTAAASSASSPDPRTYPGAAVLASRGAVRGGARDGALPSGRRRRDRSSAPRWPEVVAGAAAGCRRGWSAPASAPGRRGGRACAVERAARQRRAVRRRRRRTALPRAASRARRGRRRPLLTPHAGELARLLGGRSVGRRRGVAGSRTRPRAAAADSAATVLLKGSTTLVAAPDGRVPAANRAGTPWLATAGTGDVLAGLAGALLAGGLDALRTRAAWRADVHGLRRGAAARRRADRAADVAAAVLGRAWPTWLPAPSVRPGGSTTSEP